MYETGRDDAGEGISEMESESLSEDAEEEDEDRACGSGSGRGSVEAGQKEMAKKSASDESTLDMDAMDLRLAMVDGMECGVV